jgi:hypothetical protein
MTGSKTFNKLLKRFLADLSAAFPDNGSIRTYQTLFETAKKAFPEQPMRLFYEALREHEALVEAQDVALIEYPIFDGLDMKALWSEASEETKEAIWDYVQSLYDIAKTAPTDDASALANVSEAVQSIGGPDLGNIAESMQDMLGGVNVNDMLDMAKVMGFVDSSGQINQEKVMGIMNDIPSMMQSMGMGGGGAPPSGGGGRVSARSARRRAGRK